MKAWLYGAPWAWLTLIIGALHRGYRVLSALLVEGADRFVKNAIKPATLYEDIVYSLAHALHQPSNNYNIVEGNEKHARLELFKCTIHPNAKTIFYSIRSALLTFMNPCGFAHEKSRTSRSPMLSCGNKGWFVDFNTPSTTR